MHFLFTVLMGALLGLILGIVILKIEESHQEQRQMDKY